MVVVFPTAFASVPPDSFPLVGACKLGVVDSSYSYLFEVRVVLCPIFWGNFWVAFLVVIPRSGEFCGPNNVVVPSGCDKVGAVVWL